jgi:hypothetical protein
MNRAKVLLLAVLVGLLAGSAVVGLGLAPEIKRYVIAGGGGRSASGGYAVDGTIGQALVGSSSSGGLRVQGGFWPGTGLAPTAEPTATATATQTATATPTATQTHTRTATPTATQTHTRTATHTATSTGTATLTATPEDHAIYLPVVLRQYP